MKQLIQKFRGDQSSEKCAGDADQEFRCSERQNSRLRWKLKIQKEKTLSWRSLLLSRSSKSGSHCAFSPLYDFYFSDARKCSTSHSPNFCGVPWRLFSSSWVSLGVVWECEDSECDSWGGVPEGAKGRCLQPSQPSNPCTSALPHRGTVPRGPPASLKYNPNVSGSQFLQKSQDLLPDSISRSAGPCRLSQSDLDMERPFLLPEALCTTRLYTSIRQSKTTEAGSHPQSDCD